MKAIISIFILLPFISFGQNKNDAELWTGISLQYDASKKLSFGYDAQTRFDKNFSNLKTFFNEIEAEYEILNDVDFGISYRYSQRFKTDYFENDNRIALNLSYGFKLSETGLKFKARGRYQWGFDRLTAINEYIYPENEYELRLKLNLKYENDAFKRIIPFVEYEMFKPILDSPNINFLTAYRIAGGLKFDLVKKHEFEISYIFDRTIQTGETSHIYAIKYAYEITDKLFKKKKK